MIPCWSTANYTAEHRDLQAVCLATSNNGRCALISRRSISIIDTENLSNVEYNIKRDTKWDTTYAEFSTIQHSSIAITNAQTIQIFNTDDTSPNSLIHTLRGHTRTITDLNWSYSTPYILATASYDNYMHVWDLRDSKKAAQSMHSIAGATQVKWSKMNDYTLATSHEGDVRIWDKRKSNTPVHYITAHLSKINGIDWNPFITSQFVTCSQDGNIKFWDTNSFMLKGKSDCILTTGLPVWKARFTPFENGLMTALVPQLRRTGENNSLWMWNISSLSRPLHSFAGHLDVVLDFGWNVKSNTECELVTWAKDSILRLWKLDGQTFQNSISSGATGYPGGDTMSGDMIDGEYPSDSESTKASNIDLSRSSNPSPISSKFESTRSENEAENDSDAGKGLESTAKATVAPPTGIILNLSQEFSLVNQSIPNIIIEELNASKRICIVATKSALSCRLKIFFPPSYPHNIIPQFTFLNDHSGDNSPPSSKGPNSTPSKGGLPETMKKELLKVLQTTATSQVQRNRTCLEKCLRQFIQTFERLTASNVASMTLQKNQTNLLDLLPSHKYGSYLDASVPFPRTSGARFCSSDILVCFGRPAHLETMSAPNEFTPRSLSTLSAYLTSHVRAYNSNFNANSKDNGLSISYFYSNRRRKQKHKGGGGGGATGSNHSAAASAEKANSPKQKAPSLCGPVKVFSASKLLPISRTLADDYILTSKDGIIGICEMNSRIANNASRRDLFQTWNLVRLSAEIYLKNLHNTDTFLTPWSEHPFGRRMIQSMIEHYALKCNDIQMAAMIACAFSPSNIKSEAAFKNTLLPFEEANSSKLSSPMAPAAFSATPDTYGDWSVINSKEIRRTRSNSWSEYGESGDYGSSSAFKTDAHSRDSHAKYESRYSDGESILDAELLQQYDYYKRIYADVLYRWKMIEKRAIILRSIHSPQPTTPESQDGSHYLPFASKCPTYRCRTDRPCAKLVCEGCKKVSLNCVLCRLPVRGAANNCIKCGHGGHTVHMHDWFMDQDQCPSGCGCVCMS